MEKFSIYAKIDLNVAYDERKYIEALKNFLHEASGAITKLSSRKLTRTLAIKSLPNWWFHLTNMTTRFVKHSNWLFLSATIWGPNILTIWHSCYKKCFTGWKKLKVPKKIQIQAFLHKFLVYMTETWHLQKIF